MSKPPKPATDHNEMKLMTLLSFIAIYFRSQHYETPCTNANLALLHLLDSYLHLSCNYAYHYCSSNAHAKKTQKILQFSKQKNTLKSADSWYFMERRGSSRRRINVQALKKVLTSFELQQRWCASSHKFVQSGGILFEAAIIFSGNSVSIPSPKSFEKVSETD